MIDIQFLLESQFFSNEFQLEYKESEILIMIKIKIFNILTLILISEKEQVVLFFKINARKP